MLASDYLRGRSIFNDNQVSIFSVDLHLEISYPSAKTTVEKLKTAGILEQVGESSAGKIYTAPDILKIIT